MDDLTAFITARLDEDEAIARAAFSGQADPENGWGIDGRAITPHVGVIHEEVQRVHVARHNPARALREVEGKRAMLSIIGNRRNQYDGIDDGVANDLLEQLASAWSDHIGYPLKWAHRIE